MSDISEVEIDFHAIALGPQPQLNLAEKLLSEPFEATKETPVEAPQRNGVPT